MSDPIIRGACWGTALQYRNGVDIYAKHRVQRAAKSRIDTTGFRCSINGWTKFRVIPLAICVRGGRAKDVSCNRYMISERENWAYTGIRCVQEE
jgi:hypothetical protein